MDEAACLEDWTCAVIGSLQELSGCERSWHELEDRAHARPFQGFDWHVAWLTTLGAAAGYRPRIVLLRRGGRLVGVLPMAWRRRLGLGILDWSGHGVTDYNEALLDPELDAQAALAALWQAAAGGYGIDVARLTHLPPDSPGMAFFAPRAARAAAGESTWTLSLPQGGRAAWLAQLPSKLRANHLRCLRRLAEVDARFRVWSPGEPMAPYLDALTEQKRAWSATTGVTTILDRAAGEAFVRTAAERLAARHALHLAGLWVGGRFIACTLNFVQHGTLYGYMVARDQTWNRVSPGQSLVLDLIGSCCDRQLARVDLLGGDQEFKQRFGFQPTQSRNLTLSCGPVGRAALAARRVIEATGGQWLITRLAAGRSSASAAGKQAQRPDPRCRTCGDRVLSRPDPG